MINIPGPTSGASGGGMPVSLSLPFLLLPSLLLSPSFRPSYPRCWNRSLNNESPPWVVSEGDGVCSGEPGGLGGPLRPQWFDAGRVPERTGQLQAVRQGVLSWARQALRAAKRSWTLTDNLGRREGQSVAMMCGYWGSGDDLRTPQRERCRLEVLLCWGRAAR